MRAFEANLDRFKALHTQVLGVSHNSTESQSRFGKKLDLHFPLLSDPRGEAAKYYSSKGLLPFFSRKTFVIDGRGVLRMVHSGMPDVEKLITFLNGLQGDL
jgi:peroxiredoxin Q/BCP